MSQATIQNKAFYKGISLKEYMRKSVALIAQMKRQETLIVDEFNQPMNIFENLSLPLQINAKISKLDRAQLSTKVSTTKSIDLDKKFPSQKSQVPMLIHKERKIQQINCSDLLLKHKYKNNFLQLPAIGLSKGKNMKRQNLIDKRGIKRRSLQRQKCLASREVSQDSQNQSQSFEKGFKRCMKNKEYIEQIKVDVQQRRNLILKKTEEEINKRRRSQLKDRPLTSRIRL